MSQIVKLGTHINKILDLDEYRTIDLHSLESKSTLVSRIAQFGYLREVRSYIM